MEWFVQRSFVAVMAVGLVVALAASVGCSGGGWASTGLSIARHASKDSSGGSSAGGDQREYYIDVMLDGNEGSREKHTGDIKFSDAVNQSPSFKYTVRDKEEFGKITSVILNIHLMHPERKDAPFDASYVIALASADTSKLAFEPNRTYHFAEKLEGVKVIYPQPYKGDRDGTVRLPGNSHFCMTVSVTGSRAETARVMFETR